MKTNPRDAQDPSEPARQARLALACLDLTSLNTADTEDDIARLCDKAVGPHGHVAAVCVWPRLAAFARRRLPPEVAVAAVANFPDGAADPAGALRDVALIVEAGAQEVDVVLPWRHVVAGDDASATALLRAVRKASGSLRLKVIIESGELAAGPLIARACRLSLAEGADFLKTSTGKTAIGATADAARVMLQAIADDDDARTRVGFKASGGVRTVAEAAVYMDLVRASWGDAALAPARFRIGASSLLADIDAILRGGPGAPHAHENPGAPAPGSLY
jgi:deoxyribose-phosphate aldolase